MTDSYCYTCTSRYPVFNDKDWIAAFLKKEIEASGRRGKPNRFPGICGSQ